MGDFFSDLIRRSHARRQCRDGIINLRDRVVVPIRPYVTHFLKQDADKKIFPVEKLSIELYRPNNGIQFSTYQAHPCFIDAPFHFVLTYQCDSEERPLVFATLGFRFGRLMRNTIFIEQIQGLSLGPFKPYEPQEAVLKSLRWEKMLINIAEDWAVQNGFGAVAIRRARFNRWWLENRDGEHNMRLKMRYDVTAQRMKYRRKRFLRKYLWKCINRTARTETLILVPSLS